MDLATLIGFLAAVGVVLMAVMMGGDIGLVINGPSGLIVVAGSAGVVMMKFSLGQFFGGIKIALKAFFYKVEQPVNLIGVVTELSDTARKNGMLALESVEIDDPFLEKGVQYLIDGTAPEQIQSTLENELEQTVERHLQGQQIFKALGDVAPAMGMIGTLIGLVQMLSNMSDPQSIGPAMALAMLTTLYGAILANMVALPIADKLELRSKEERIIKAMIIDAIMSIQQGQNPRILKDFLNTYLPGSQRVSDDMGGSTEAASEVAS